MVLEDKSLTIKLINPLNPKNQINLGLKSRTISDSLKH